MNIHLVWAQDLNGGIGKNGKLPWHISEDLQNFKKITLDSVIIMGRSTWNSLPLKPLPKRRNIVLSNTKIENVEVYHTINDCIDILKKEKIELVYIIGGATIYKQFFEFADFLHITFIDAIISDIDIFFPLSMKEIKNLFLQTSGKQLSNNTHYTFWSRIKKS
jgi:dihydrofolate reductase